MLPLTDLPRLRIRAGGDLTDAETANATAWIGQASAMLRHLIPGLDARVASGGLSDEMVAGVVTEAVWRAVQNDRIGYRVRSEGFPEVSTAWRDADDDAVLRFLDSELALLAPRDDGRGAFSITPASS